MFIVQKKLLEEQAFPYYDTIKYLSKRAYDIYLSSQQFNRMLTTITYLQSNEFYQAGDYSKSQESKFEIANVTAKDSWNQFAVGQLEIAKECSLKIEDKGLGAKDYIETQIELLNVKEDETKEQK